MDRSTRLARWCLDRLLSKRLRRLSLWILNLLFSNTRAVLRRMIVAKSHLHQWETADLSQLERPLSQEDRLSLSLLEMTRATTLEDLELSAWTLLASAPRTTPKRWGGESDSRQSEM